MFVSPLPSVPVCLSSNGFGLPRPDTPAPRSGGLKDHWVHRVTSVSCSHAFHTRRDLTTMHQPLPALPFDIEHSVNGLLIFSFWGIQLSLTRVRPLFALIRITVSHVERSDKVSKPPRSADIGTNPTARGRCDYHPKIISLYLWYDDFS